MSDKEVMDVAQEHVVRSGWTDTLQERGRSVMGWLHESRSLILDMFLYGGLGFLFGFLLRKYSNYVAFLVLVSVALIAMQQYGLIDVTINWTRINDLLGLHQSPLLAEGISFAALWDWSKANAVIVVSYIIGVLIGLRVG